MKIELKTLNDIENLLRYIKGINCFTFRESEMHRIMHGEAYKLDIVYSDKKNTVIVQGLPSDICGGNLTKDDNDNPIVIDKYIPGFLAEFIINELSTDYNVKFKHDGEPLVMFIPFTDNQVKEIKDYLNNEFNKKMRNK